MALPTLAEIVAAADYAAALANRLNRTQDRQDAIALAMQAAAVARAASVIAETLEQTK